MEAATRGAPPAAGAASLPPPLLRPDVPFTEWWKLCVVATLLLELLTLLLAKEAGPITIDAMLRQFLLPGECLPMYTPAETAAGGMKKLVSFLRRNKPKPPPLYCASSLRVRALAAMAGHLAPCMRCVVGIIATLDVPVTFFTGRLSPTTGLLEVRFETWGRQDCLHSNYQKSQRGLIQFTGTLLAMQP